MSSENYNKVLEDLVVKTYDEWEIYYNNNKVINTPENITEIDGDLFKQPKEYSLAHCVAEDLKMRRGIATCFRRKFKNLKTLYSQKAKQGGLALLSDVKNKRFIYYLVTKKVSAGKPTYLNLFKSLCQMRRHIKGNQVKKLAIPRLGCGLDRLKWDRVKSMIIFLFQKIDIQIIICNFN